MTESKKGISTNQMKRTIGVAYKTAWYICHGIRKAMNDAQPVPLKGIVEVDETYIDRKAKSKRTPGRSTVDTSMVVAAIERAGDVRMKGDRRATNSTSSSVSMARTTPKPS